MIRFFLRTIAVFCLALAVMFAVVDATKSVGVSELVLTPLSDSMSNFIPATYDSMVAWLEQNAPEFVIETLVANLISLPTFIVAAGLAFLFYLLSYRRKRRASRFLRS